MNLMLNKLVVTFGLCFLGAPVFANTHPTSLIQNMLDSMAYTNYEGTFVYAHNGELDVISIKAGVNENGRFQQLEAQNGEPRQFEFSNGVLSWFHENYWQKVGAPDRTNVKPSQLMRLWQERLAKYYNFELGGLSRVANSACQEVLISPKDRLRYGYQLCISVDNKLLLESKLFDQHNRVLEHIVFTHIAQVDTAHAHGTIASPTAKAVVSQRTTLDVPIMQRMPAGFKLMSREMKQMSGQSAAIEHWRISDGLANISVYVEPAGNKNAALSGGSSVGAISVYGMIENGYQVTVIGDVPSNTLKIIANALGS